MFVENDPELVELYTECYKITKDILLPPAIKDDNPPVSNETVENWRKAALHECYLEELYRNFEDFCTKNPDFYAALKSKLSDRQFNTNGTKTQIKLGELTQI